MFTRYLIDIDGSKHEVTCDSLESAALALSEMTGNAGMVHAIEVKSQDKMTLISATAMLEDFYETRKQVGRKAWAEIKADHIEDVSIRPLGINSLVMLLVSKIQTLELNAQIAAIHAAENEDSL